MYIHRYILHETGPPQRAFLLRKYPRNQQKAHLVSAVAHGLCEQPQCAALYLNRAKIRQEILVLEKMGQESAKNLGAEWKTRAARDASGREWSGTESVVLRGRNAAMTTLYHERRRESS